jgi:hypothetical protein
MILNRLRFTFCENFWGWFSARFAEHCTKPSACQYARGSQLWESLVKYWGFGQPLVLSERRLNFCPCVRSTKYFGFNSTSKYLTLIRVLPGFDGKLTVVLFAGEFLELLWHTILDAGSVRSPWFSTPEPSRSTPYFLGSNRFVDKSSDIYLLDRALRRYNNVVTDFWVGCVTQLDRVAAF